MGLDQYLKASFFVAGYAHNGQPAQDKFTRILTELGVAGLTSKDSPSMEVNVTIMYWRKANAIHKWFVANVQGGEDDCEQYYVSREQLQELAGLCKLVNTNPESAAEKLPTTSGFFFGGTGYDGYYYQQLLDTAKTIEAILANPKLERCSFYYQSSW